MTETSWLLQDITCFEKNLAIIFFIKKFYDSNYLINNHDINYICSIIIGKKKLFFHFVGISFETKFFLSSFNHIHNYHKYDSDCDDN